MQVELLQSSFEETKNLKYEKTNSTIPFLNLHNHYACTKEPIRF